MSITTRKPAHGRRVLDRTDRRILSLIQTDARLTNKELAQKVNLSPTPCLRRVALLEKEGFIVRHKAVLDTSMLGLTVRAFLTIKRSRESNAQHIWDQLMAIPEVIACHVVTGDSDVLVELLAHDMEHYAQLTLGTIAGIEGVYDVRSMLSIKALKTDGNLPVERGDAA